MQRAIADSQKAIDARKSAAKADFDQWLERLPGSPAPRYEEPAEGSRPFLSLPLVETSGPFHGTVDSEPIEWPGPSERRAGPFGQAPQVADGAVVEKATPAVTRSGKASYGAFLYIEEKPSGAVFSRMNKGQGYRGWDLFLTEGRPTVHIVERWPEKALKVTAKEALKPGRWHHVMAVYDGKRNGADAIALWVDGRKADVEVNNNDLGKNIYVDAPFRLGGRSDKDAVVDTITGGKVFLQDLRFYQRALTPIELAQVATPGLVREYLATATDQRSAKQTQALFELYLTTFDPPIQKLQAEMAQLKSEEDEFRQRGATTLVMDERKDSSPSANILIRGNYASKGAQVSAATPNALAQMAPRRYERVAELSASRCPSAAAGSIPS